MKRFVRALEHATLLLLLALTALIASTTRLPAQNRYEWSVFSSLKEGRSITVDDRGVVWTATTGGIFSYDPVADSFRVYRTTEGLLKLSALSIAFDTSSGSLYVGSDDGSISILGRDGVWNYSTDIAAARDKPDRRVLGFGFRDGKAYILTAFGVAVYNPVDSTLSEAYVNFRGLPVNTSINGILFYRDSIWLSTPVGIVYAPQRGRVLTDPTAWNFIPAASIGGAASINSIIEMEGRFTVGTSQGIYHRNDDGTFGKRQDLPSNTVHIVDEGGYILAYAETSLYRFDSATHAFREGRVVPDGIVDAAVMRDGTPVVALGRIGFGYLLNEGFVVSSPTSPVSNIFSNLAFGWDRSIWVSSGVGSNGRGVSRLTDTGWIEYTKKNTPELKSDEVWHVSKGAGNSIWTGHFPGGFTKFTEEGIVGYDNRNSPLVGTRLNDNEVIGAQAAEQGGRTWLINWDNTDRQGPVLLEYKSDGGFTVHLSSDKRAYRWLAIDGNGTKWLGSDASQSARGLTWYNERETLPVRSRTFTTSNGLPSNLITALMIDPDGELWVGTSSGLVVLRNPSGVVNNEGDQPSFRTILALKDIGIHGLAVDALNQKWVGTDEGVYLFNSDGSELLQRFTASTSPLVDNRVLSILSDDGSGDIYIGTMNGMNKVSTPAVEPPTPAERITVSPHPFRLPSSEPLRITGLPGNASIKILSLSGTLLREFESPGGAIAFWDGLAQDGTLVPSGIYLIAAGTKSGEETVVGKVAVVRE